MGSPNSSATATSPNFIPLFLIMVLASNLLLLSHVHARQLGRMPEPLGLVDQTNNENKEKVVEPMTKARENHRLGTDEVKNLPTFNIPFVPPLPQFPFAPPLPDIHFPPIPFPPPIPQIPGFPPLPTIPTFPPFNIPNIPFLDIPPPA